MKVKLTLSANAGLCVEFGGKTVWVDALHDSAVPGFSRVCETLQERILAGEFPKPDYLLFTHLHPDHYSAALTEKALKLYPEARLLMPGESNLSAGISCMRLPHEGAQYADTEHYGIVLSAGEKRIFVSGDCAVAEPNLAGRYFDLALLDFPWLTLRRGREFLAQNPLCKQMVLYHIPFAEDDVNGYCSAAQKAAEQYGAQLLCEPLQILEFEL